jgi:hypothetical protein
MTEGKHGGATTRLPRLTNGTGGLIAHVGSDPRAPRTARSQVRRGNAIADNQNQQRGETPQPQSPISAARAMMRPGTSTAAYTALAPKKVQGLLAGLINAKPVLSAEPHPRCFLEHGTVLGIIRAF